MAERTAVTLYGETITETSTTRTSVTLFGAALGESASATAAVIESAPTLHSIEFGNVGLLKGLHTIEIGHS